MTINLTLADIGLSEHTTSEMSVDHAGLVAATIGSSLQPNSGIVLPLLWHWAYFGPSAPTANLGDDGHPLLPSSPISGFPRRMWVSGKVQSLGPLVLGEPAIRTSRIVNAKESAGRSGSLIIVTVLHRVHQGGIDRIVEEQSLAYRAGGGPVASLPTGDHRVKLQEDQWADRHTPNSRLLFRFSAVTFNTHRIHFDQPYATAHEGYPALVVQGPLTALLVAESIRRTCEKDLVRFEFRAIAPLFVDSTFTIVGSPSAEISAEVFRNDGVKAMEVVAELDS